jgi:hypothetical protein
MLCYIKLSPYYLLFFSAILASHQRNQHATRGSHLLCSSLQEIDLASNPKETSSTPSNRFWKPEFSFENF